RLLGSAVASTVAIIRGVLSRSAACVRARSKAQPRQDVWCSESAEGSMRYAALALVLLLGQASVRPAFEVATIKRNISGDGGSIGIEPGGRFRAITADVRFMIAAMYRPAGGPRLFPSQIVGLPDWASTEKYDIIGK